MRSRFRIWTGISFQAAGPPKERGPRVAVLSTSQVDFERLTLNTSEIISKTGNSQRSCTTHPPTWATNPGRHLVVRRQIMLERRSDVVDGVNCCRPVRKSCLVPPSLCACAATTRYSLRRGDRSAPNFPVNYVRVVCRARERTCRARGGHGQPAGAQPDHPRRSHDRCGL